MNIDDFPFDSLLEGKKKIEFNILIQKVRVLLSSEREMEWARIAGIAEDKEEWMFSKAHEDCAIIKEVMEVYMKMGYVIEQVIFKAITRDIVWWSIDSNTFWFDMKKPWQEIDSFVVIQ